MNLPRIAITGVGLTAPNGDSLAQFRRNLLAGVAGIEWLEVRYMGRLLAGPCHFDPLRYQKKKEVRVGTRAGSISIWCAREAIADSAVGFDAFPKDRVGIYIGCTEHGNSRESAPPSFPKEPGPSLADIPKAVKQPIKLRRLPAPFGMGGMESVRIMGPTECRARPAARATEAWFPWGNGAPFRRDLPDATPPRR